MRTWLVVLIAGGALASAGGAFAQNVDNSTYSVMSAAPPTGQSYGVYGQPQPGADLRAAIPDPYVRKLAFLKNKLMFLKAKDGGHLTPDHAAALQRELDALNRETASRRE